MKNRMKTLRVERDGQYKKDNPQKPMWEEEPEITPTQRNSRCKCFKK